jgi:hypothetical protein
MALWSEDFSGFSLEEVLKSQVENRAWSKDLRRRTNDLVNSRLANTISRDDYIANRKVGHEEAAECRRRAAILDSQIGRRTGREQAAARPPESETQR